MNLAQFPMAVQQSTHGVQHAVMQLWRHLPQEMKAALMHLTRFVQHLTIGSQQALQQLRRHLAMLWQQSLMFLPMVIRLVLMHLPQSMNGRQQAFPLAITHLPQAVQQLSKQNLRLLQQILQGLQHALILFLQAVQRHFQGQHVSQEQRTWRFVQQHAMEMDQVMQQMHTIMPITNGIPTKPTINHT